MKATILTITIALGILFSANVQAQSFDSIYKKYKKEDSVTGIKVDKLGCFLAALFAGSEDEGAQLLSKTSDVHILVSETANSNDISKDVQTFIRKAKLDQLMNVQDGNDVIDVYIQEKNKEIRELLVVINNPGEQVYMHLTGKFPLQMIKDVMSGGNPLLTVKSKL